jgi:hypothetical protein
MSKSKSHPCRHPKKAIIPATDLDCPQCKKCGKFLPELDNWEDTVRVIDLTGGESADNN